MKSNQLSLIPTRSNKRFFGGSLLVGRRKTPRPLNTKQALHFVLRSQFAKGKTSFRTLKNHKAISIILKKTSAKYKIRIYRQAIQSNHIHLVLKIPNRYAAALRSNNKIPNCSSSFFTATDKVGWLTWHFSAARPKWRSCAKARI